MLTTNNFTPPRGSAEDSGRVLGDARRPYRGCDAGFQIPGAGPSGFRPVPRGDAREEAVRGLPRRSICPQRVRATPRKGAVRNTREGTEGRPTMAPSTRRSVTPRRSPRRLSHRFTRSRAVRPFLWGSDLKSRSTPKGDGGAPFPWGGDSRVDVAGLGARAPEVSSRIPLRAVTNGRRRSSAPPFARQRRRVPRTPPPENADTDNR